MPYTENIGMQKRQLNTIKVQNPEDAQRWHAIFSTPYQISKLTHQMLFQDCLRVNSNTPICQKRYQPNSGIIVCVCS